LLQITNQNFNWHNEEKKMISVYQSIMSAGKK